MSDLPKNKQAIDFLSSLEDRAFVIIFTRKDADDALSGSRGPLTDEEWEDVLYVLQKTNESHAELESAVLDYLAED